MNVKIIKRKDIPKHKEVIIRIMAVLLSIVFAGVILLAFGLNPLKIFGAIIDGSAGSEIRIKQTVLRAVPLLITSLGIIVAFKMKFWNIGAEGQITMGALGATWVALNLPEGLPAPFMLGSMMLGGFICGAIWAFIPAIFKAKMGTNETIFTLMMNYIAIKFVTYLQYGPWRDPGAQGFPKIAKFTENAILPSVLGVNIGWIIALICVAIIYVFMTRTKKGYEIAVVGESVQTARYAGINISRVIVIAMLISGGLCGIVGFIQASAIEKTLIAGIAGGYGFTAIITAWLSRLNAITCLFVCIAFAMLIQGGSYIQVSLGVSSAISGLVQGVILFFVLGSEFFLQYRLEFPKKPVKEVA
ncbi:MAG: ABC transporter permease [Eubacteriales bacterium]|nr:ABC transporter permease [Eubacteriales bacterium]MDD4389987.1 ABC transporter permease [Eubacteriales bacterium]